MKEELRWLAAQRKARRVALAKSAIAALAAALVVFSLTRS